MTPRLPDYGPPELKQAILAISCEGVGEMHCCGGNLLWDGCYKFPGGHSARKYTSLLGQDHKTLTLISTDFEPKSIPSLVQEPLKRQIQKKTHTFGICGASWTLTAQPHIVKDMEHMRSGTPIITAVAEIKVLCTLSSVTPSGQYKYRTSPFFDF